ncbi:unannotated protein [freshwater metagenome]|uniref:Unannotated protein n=1 Tax=freshwater metagenome TaxID=449393 RepID=A0A6J5YW38_9ZZZZ|nr:FCD domain-containing protein [Actinomycetota bacterium]
MNGLKQIKAVAPETGLARSAYDEIRRAILSGDLKEGSLTSVRALSEALGMSRTPVREALVELANDRLVAFERNRGVRICETQRHDIEEIFEMRLLLEVPAARAAAESMSSSDVQDLEDTLSGMKNQLSDENEFMRFDWGFHRKLLEVSGNERIVAAVEGLRDQIRTRGISTVGRSRQLDAIVTEHQAIFDAVRLGDGQAAAAAMDAHLSTTRALLLTQEDLPTNETDSKGKS